MNGLKNKIQVALRATVMTSLAVVGVISIGWGIYSIVLARLWRSRDYRCAVLRTDVELIARGTHSVVGYLKKGTALFVPVQEDMAVTDPGDVQLHKVYVRLPANLDDYVLYLPDPTAKNQLRSGDVHNVLEIVPVTRKNHENN